jgi:hypothetical protein
VALFKLGVMVLGLMWSSACMSQTTLILSVAPEIKHIFPMLETNVAQAFKELDIEVSFLEIPTARATREANSGRVDGDLLRTDEYQDYVPNYMPVLEPLGAIKIKAYTLKSKKLDTYEELIESTVATVRGAKLVADLQKIYPFKTVELLSWEKCFILVSKRKVDVALSTPHYAALLMKKHNIANLEEKSLELGEVKFYLWLKKEHHHIAEQLNDIFIKMKADGQLGLF